MTASIERLRPQSSAVLAAAYQLMSKEIERTFGRELTRLTKRKRAGAEPPPADRSCRQAGSGRAALWHG